MKSWRDLGSARGRCIGTVGFATAVGLLLAPAAGADSYPAPAYFAKGLTAESSWEEVGRTPEIYPEFPLLTFGNEFVPVTDVCVEGEALRIANPNRDNGIRLAVGPTRSRAESGALASQYAALRADRFSTDVGAATPPLSGQPSTQPGGTSRYTVDVYRVIPALNPVRVFLFQKSWDVPACAKP